jgi:hypothetical protein
MFMISRNQAGQIVFHFSEDTDEVVSALKEIFNDTPIGKKYVNGDYVTRDGDDGYEEIVKAAVTIGGPMISLPILTHALTLLIDSGELQPRGFKPAKQLAEPEEDTRPRSKDGRLLTPQQIQWGEYRRFEEVASMSEINLRKQSDPEFANFVRKNLEREMNVEVADRVEPAGQATTKARVSKELTEFAFNYNKEPIANLKPKGGFVTLAGQQIAWATFQDLLSRASAANLV